MFLISLFQECTKCHTTTTELHQSSFFGQKKPTSPQILLSLNGLQFSTYAEHSNIRTLKNRRPWSVSTEFQSQSYCHYQIGILSPVIMWRMKEISPFSREGLPLMAMSFFKAGPGCAKQTTITANLLMHLEGRLFKLWDANLEFFLALNKYVTAQVGMIL